LRDFLQSIGLAVEQISMIARELGIDADERIQAFRDSSAYKQLLRSESFKRIFDEHRSTQRAHLNSYVRQIGIDLDAHPLVLIDVGWKGSIQDYLTAALPQDVAIIGYYLGLMNIGQPLENKHGLLFTDVPRRTIDYNIYTENRTIFEIVLCADHSSALRYEIDVAGKVKVVLDDDQEELQYIQSKIIPLRDDIIRAFRMFCLDRERFCLTANELRDFAARVHLPLVFEPWRSNVKAITEATHRENFGVFATSRFSAPGAPSLRERIEFLVSLVRRPRSTLAASFWPAYTLSRYGTRMLARAYAYRRVRRWRQTVESEVSALHGGRV
ncbi:MAG TPA: hypothetical protein VJT13_11600, partial [Xanthobacteraceae bacterium]|nr:hypothetical protein [Xanthobacteraceae bacterium]